MQQPIAIFNYIGAQLIDTTKQLSYYNILRSENELQLQTADNAAILHTLNFIFEEYYSQILTQFI